MNIPKIILSRPKIVIDTVCDKCKSRDIIATPFIEVKCKNCNTKIKTDAGINIYYSIAKKLVQLVSNNNEVWLVGERDSKKVFHPEDMLKAKSRFEQDIYQTIIAVKHDFEKQKCYEVSEITNDTDLDYQTYCSDCGFCNNCICCADCGTHYVPDMTKGGEKRYTCPKCKSKRYKRSVIKFKKDKGKRTCPHCNSEDLVRRRIRSNNKTCPNCESKNIMLPRKIPIYKLVIKRQRRFELQ